MKRVVPDRPDWPFKLHHLVMHELDDGDTLAVPSTEVEIAARKLLRKYRPTILAFVDNREKGLVTSESHPET